MVLVKSVVGLTLPQVYTLEVDPLVVINGIATGVVGVVGTSQRGSIYESTPFSSYDQNFIQAYGPVYAEGAKTNVRNYLSLPLAMVAIATQGGAQVYPFRVGDIDALASGSGTITITNGGDSYTITAKTPGTWINGSSVIVEDDLSDALSTTLSANASIGAGTITVTLPIGFVAGMEIKIGTEIFTISSIAGSVFTLSGNLVSAYTTGATVSKNTPKKKVSISILSTGEEESFEQVDSFMDDLNSSSQLVTVEFTGTTEFLPSNGTRLFSDGADGVTYGLTSYNKAYYDSYVGETNITGSTGLELLRGYSNVRFVVLSEHYATFVDDTGNPNPTSGVYVDQASVKAIEVASEIGAIAILNIDDSLTYNRIIALAKHPTFKGTDRVILTYPRAKFYEQTYKSIIDISFAPFYAAMWANRNPNESPSNKSIFGTLGPNKKISLAQKKDFSDPAVGISAVAEIPRGGFGPINGLNTSPDTGKNQSLRRRMTDFILISVDQSLGDLVSELNKPTFRTNLVLRLTQFLSGLQEQGLIGDSLGGQAFSIQLDSSNNTATSVRGRKVNVTIKVALFTPADYIIIKGSVGFDGINVQAV